ncbi:hypothetical protein VTL71DRAFT_626 [Oculimacula yallundae]|uniref:C2H2-type domain-containing protein n=1 Tax=Oculimacula yallundae TaxID=86028 RepID=A0ABR4D236_9HELO
MRTGNRIYDPQGQTTSRPQPKRPRSADQSQNELQKLAQLTLTSSEDLVVSKVESDGGVPITKAPEPEVERPDSQIIIYTNSPPRLNLLSRSMSPPIAPFPGQFEDPSDSTSPSSGDSPFQGHPAASFTGDLSKTYQIDDTSNGDGGLGKLPTFWSTGNGQSDPMGPFYNNQPGFVISEGNEEFHMAGVNVALDSNEHLTSTNVPYSPLSPSGFSTNMVHHPDLLMNQPNSYGNLTNMFQYPFPPIDDSNAYVHLGDMVQQPDLSMNQFNLNGFPTGMPQEPFSLTNQFDLYGNPTSILEQPALSDIQSDFHRNSTNTVQPSGSIIKQFEGYEEDSTSVVQHSVSATGQVHSHKNSQEMAQRPVEQTNQFHRHRLAASASMNNVPPRQDYKTTRMRHLEESDFIAEYKGEYYVITCPLCGNQFLSATSCLRHINAKRDEEHRVLRNHHGSLHNTHRMIQDYGRRIVDATPETVQLHRSIRAPPKN